MWPGGVLEPSARGLEAVVRWPRLGPKVGRLGAPRFAPAERPSGAPRIRFAARYGRSIGSQRILSDGPARIFIASNAIAPWRVYEMLQKLKCTCSFYFPTPNDDKWQVYDE